MSAAVKNHPVLSSDRAPQEARASWRELKRRWIRQCPQCGQKWLVIGARAGEEHKCKSCHHSFFLEANR